MYFDAHAHLDDEQFDDLIPVVEAMQQAAVCGVVNASCDVASCHTSQQLARTYDWCYCTAGIHPHYAAEVTDADYDEVVQCAAYAKCVAIGEIGLDYHYDFSPREAQREVFVRQLALAHSLHLPVVLHLREAYADANAILLANRALLTDGVLLHCYSGSAELVRDVYNELDCYYSFGGALTFAKHKAEVLAAIPPQRLLLETDCPYMTPVPYRGTRNSPANLPLIAAKMAELLGMSVEQVAELTTQNAHRLYRL